MLKIVSENFIHAFLLFLGLFLKISRWVPLSVVVQIKLSPQAIGILKKRKKTIKIKPQNASPTLYIRVKLVYKSVLNEQPI